MSRHWHTEDNGADRPASAEAAEAERQKRSGVHDCMVYDHFISFQNTRQDLTTQRESICNIKMAVMMFFDIFNNLARLIVY